MQTPCKRRFRNVRRNRPWQSARLMGEHSGERVGKSPVEASSCWRSIAYPPVSRETSLTCIGPNGAFRYVSRPALRGKPKPRPTAVVDYYTLVHAQISAKLKSDRHKVLHSFMEASSDYFPN